MGDLIATVAGQTWHLESGAKLTGRVTVEARLTLQSTARTGTIERPRTAYGAWFDSKEVHIKADDTVIQDLAFVGGGTPVYVTANRVKILRNHLSGQGSYGIWARGDDATKTARNGLEIIGNTIIQPDLTPSPIINRNDDATTYFARNWTIRGNTIESLQSRRFRPGPEQWPGGIELFGVSDSLIENNTLRGGEALISLPSSNHNLIQGNNFDLRGLPFWGVELHGEPRDIGATSGDSNRVQSNTVLGDADDVFVVLSTWTRNDVVHANRVTDVGSLVFWAVDASGRGPLEGNQVTDNCLTGVRNIESGPRPANATVERNGPC